MTKETKIGLLVGLAFIILFAIILSGNGGARGTASPSTFTVADASGAKGTPTGAEKPLHNEGRLPVEAQLPPVVQRTPPLPPKVLPLKEKTVESRTAPDVGAAAGAVPPSVVEYLNEPVAGDDEDPDARPHGAGTTETVPLREAVTSALEESEKRLAKAAEQGEAAKPPKAPGTAGGKGRGASTPEAAVAASTDAAKPAGEVDSAQKADGGRLVIKTVHEVQPGESVGKIAAKYYGRSTPQRIEAIYNANRDVLKDVQKVKASDKLKIPALEGHEGEFEAAPQFPTAANMTSVHAAPSDGLTRIPPPVGETSKPPKKPSALESGRGGIDTSGLASAEKAETLADKTAPGTPKVRWYVVKKSDTLSTISQKELGTSKRCQEILDLNKDVIRDRNRLRAGAKIRLPDKSASSEKSGAPEPEKTETTTT